MYMHKLLQDKFFNTGWLLDFGGILLLGFLFWLVFILGGLFVCLFVLRLAFDSTKVHTHYFNCEV